MVTVGVAIIGLGAGFAATVWAVVGFTSLRLHHKLAGFAYLALVWADLSLAVLAISIVAHHPIVAPAGVTTLILATIIVAPAGFHLRTWRQAKLIVTEARNGNGP